MSLGSKYILYFFLLNQLFLQTYFLIGFSKVPIIRQKNKERERSKGEEIELDKEREREIRNEKLRYRKRK